MNALRRPTRRDLLLVIGRLQDKIGRARGANNDRNPNRFAEIDGVLQEAQELCVAARSYDPPIFDRLGPWGEDGSRKEYA